MRKHTNMLLENNLIEPMNKGGIPEFFRLTKKGQFILEELQNATD